MKPPPFYSTVVSKVPIIMILLLFVGFLTPLWLSPVNLYASFTDDFYYYLKIAGNFNHGLGLTFTPHVPTNGYQPFFQFFMVGLVYIAHLAGIPELVLIRIVLALLFLFFSFWLLRLLRPKGGVATLFFVLGLLSFYFISYSGMETIFIVPLLTYFVIALHRRLIGLYRAAFLVMLAFFLRIDSIIITLPLFAWYLRNSYSFIFRPWRTAGISALIITMPIAGYLAINYLNYHTLFPISGLAKTVLKWHTINGATFDSFIHYYPYNLFNVAVTGLCVLIALTANFREKAYFHLLALTTLLFYVQTALRSDWGLWPWYFFPIPTLAFVAATFGRGLFTARQSRFPTVNRLLYATAAASSTMVVLFSSVVWVFYTFPVVQTTVAGRGKVDILHVAGLKLKDFEQHHHGVYAMGDRAGIVGYLTSNPLIQMEGLVMDKNYMGHFMHSNKLRQLFNNYRVDYYIASNPVRLNDSTYIVKEPFQSHGLSHQITDTICWNVCDSFTLRSKGVFTNRFVDDYKTIVFRVPSDGKQTTVSMK